MDGSREHLAADREDQKAGQHAIRSDVPAAGGPSVRVIVDFPTGTALPAEGATFTRDAARGFQIVDVRKSQDGANGAVVNVYVREIAQP